MKFPCKKTVSFCAVAAILLSFAFVPAKVSAENETSSSIVITDENDYRAYLSNNSGYKNANDSIVIHSVSANMEYESVLSADFNITEAANYELRLTYTAKKAQDLVLSFKIDEQLPFSEAERIEFPCYFVNENSKWKNQVDQFTPEQIYYGESIVALAQDYSGKNENPYVFFLSEGNHKAEIKVLQGNFALEKIEFVPLQNADKYKKPNITDNDKEIIIEGEDAFLKSDKSLIPLSDQASALVNPCNAINRQLNYIGGSNWQSPGQSITWKFNVAETGYYKLGFHYRQSQKISEISYRSLKIDNSIPFKEAERVKFKYETDWNYMIFSDEKTDEPYYFKLDEGDHTITLTVTSGAISDIYAQLQNVTSSMGNLYVDITKIIGETVDIYRSYELFKQIPDFNKSLESIAKELESIAEMMLSLQEADSGSSVSIINDAVRVINQMIEKPYSAHKYKSQFYDAYTNLSALMTDMTNMPLDIDQIIFHGNSAADIDANEISFFEKCAFSIKRFLHTFVGDYNGLSISENAKGEPLNIWMNWGRDQAEALNNLIQDGFVRENNIPVSVSLVNASLINGILSGNGPDLLIQMSRTEPVNLAMRGALVDLSEFDDFAEVKNRFTSNATVPYEYNGGVYALPVTQGFNMMFVRTDILNSLGIAIPETWEEFIDAAAILQRNNLQAVIPYTQLADGGTVNSGVGSLSLYPTMLIQNNLPIYNDDKNASILSNVEQTQVFVKWTDFYTKYKFQAITNFYNRFRIGSAPLGIERYTLYTQLKSAAPEISGRWTVALIPGTKDENGNINHSSAGWGSGCSITQLSKQPEKAWEFLKWWTSSNTQLKYSNMIESVLGPLGRVATANTEALSQMDWDMEMYENIFKQQQLTVEIPEIPGGYYTARGIDQAYWNVVEAGKDPTEMIKKWNKAVNNEITRKIAEYESE